jgi:transcriptional regulator with XRE-family HTH domain
MSIGERIGILAKKKKINLHKLADAADVSYNTLYSIVRRKSDKVDPETLKKVARVLEVPVWELGGLFDDASQLLDGNHDLHDVIQAHNDKITTIQKSNALEFAESVYARDIISAFGFLNERGQEEAATRVYELAYVPKYQRTAPTEPQEPAHPNTDTQE